MDDNITVKTTVRFKPFKVPNFATMALGPRPRQEGMTEQPSVPVSELEPEVLDALAEKWLDQLYASCKRRSPFYTSARNAAVGPS